MIGAKVEQTPGEAVGARGKRAMPGPADLSPLLQQFPPRPVAPSWPATQESRGQVLARVLAPPFTFGNAQYQDSARRGLTSVLTWLAATSGDTWQQRWLASGAEQAADWRTLPAEHTGWVAGRRKPYTRDKTDECTTGLMLLICADVIRPSTRWLLVTKTPKNLAASLARTRDPLAFAALIEQCGPLRTAATTRNLALARIATIMAAKGGLVRDITVGDCIEMHRIASMTTVGRPFFYQLLRSLGGFPPDAPMTVRMFGGAAGQMTVEQMIDRYGIECRPVRNLLVDYLREFLVASDYSTVLTLSYVLGKMFWRDLELHHPGIDSLHLAPEVAAAWKQRLRTKITRTRTADGGVVETQSQRISATDNLGTVRAFYRDLAEWAHEDPARWAPWVTVCPVRDIDLNFKKINTRRKSRMDQRTRERLPMLPALVAAAEAGRTASYERLHTATEVRPGELFTAGGQTLLRPILPTGAGGRIWGQDPDTGKRRDLEAEERRAFWAWAAVEVLRLTGIRIEELTELSHHSLIHYRLPTTRELVPLLQIAPSKTDTERLLVISPELADVLSTIITRIRNPDGSVPLVAAYDYGERTWNPPMPLLFQRRVGLENRSVGKASVARCLDQALADTGLTDASGAPLRFTPHDFRRVFITDAIMHGMPPHIAQLVAGHRDINTTMGYKAVYPEEVINGHRAFITRRRNLRPSEEYRTPTDSEWQEFLGHFERRRVALGDCGRSYATPCIHEHSCLRCPLLRPSSQQRNRIEAIRDNLNDRITEAVREGWTGEVDGLKVSLAGAKQKLDQLDQMARRNHTVGLGLPAFRDVAGRTSSPTTPRHPTRKTASDTPPAADNRSGGPCTSTEQSRS
ncbi:site-specific integrase [Micromonospora sp. NPDC053740]|uniref:tyrosine-type recombinase/integrase n=1 Tax=Micromonospora sp. NPDC053740 TaxID=3155173 RepID=UPI003417F852